MPWKQRMLAVFWDLGLEKYIAKDAKAPESADATKPETTAEAEVKKKWEEEDGKARTQIKVSIRNAKMTHISGTNTASQMWEQLCMVKESKSQLGVLATRHVLYRATAEEGFDIVEHISNLQKFQELHIMDNLVSDEGFLMILITSLPESWDNYTSSYLGSLGNKPDLKSHELIAILLEEER